MENAEDHLKNLLKSEKTEEYIKNLLKPRGVSILERMKDPLYKRQVKQIIEDSKWNSSSFRKAIHNIIDTVFFLPIGEDYRDALHFGVINIFNVAAREPNLPVIMYSTTILAILGRSVIEKIFTVAGNIITELFSIAGAIVIIAGEALGSTLGIPIVGLAGMLTGYGIYTKIVNGTVMDQELEKKIKTSMGEDLDQNQITVKDLLMQLVNYGQQTIHVDRLNEERKSRSRDIENSR